MSVSFKNISFVCYNKINIQEVENILNKISLVSRYVCTHTYTMEFSR